MEVVMHYKRGNLSDFMRGIGTGYLWSTAIHGSNYQGLGFPLFSRDCVQYAHAACDDVRILSALKLCNDPPENLGVEHLIPVECTQRMHVRLEGRYSSIATGREDLSP